MACWSCEKKRQAMLNAMRDRSQQKPTIFNSLQPKRMTPEETIVEEVQTIEEELLQIPEEQLQIPEEVVVEPAPLAPEEVAIESAALAPQQFPNKKDLFTNYYGI